MSRQTVPPRILLIGWDAADWKWLNTFLDAGETPTLSQIVDNGIAGELQACQPLNTAAAWTSIITGKRPWQHGITHSRELDSTNQQIVPISTKYRRSRALWDMLGEHDLRSVVVGWPATQGSNSDKAVMVSDRYSEPTAPPGVKPWPPALAGTYSPADLAKNLDARRVNPADIGADIIARHIPHWQRIDQQRDRRMGQLRVLLTVDFSHFAAAQYLLQHSQWNFGAIRFATLGHLAKLFLPFNPPRQEWINESEFELYRDVLRIECRALDQMLAALRKTAGPDTTIIVVSSHGTRTPDVPPTGFSSHHEDAWKTPTGILAASGPRLKKDALLHGASALDIAPTILTLFGLPLGEDMEGRVLMEGFEQPPEIQRIETWEKKESEAPTSFTSNPSQLSPAVQRIQNESDWNYVQSCLEAGQLAMALPRLEQLFRSFPERADICHAFFQCQLNLGRLDDAQATLEVLCETVPPGVGALLPQAELALAKRDLRQTRDLINQIRNLKPNHPMALQRLGILLLRLREWNALAELAQAALKLDDKNPIVWLGLAEASLRQHKAREAEDAARRAIQLKFFLPDAHFILARALVAQNKWDAAREAMAALIQLQPDNRAAAYYNKRLANR